MYGLNQERRIFDKILYEVDSMNIQNNNMEPETSQNYVWHSMRQMNKTDAYYFDFLSMRQMNKTDAYYFDFLSITGPYMTLCI
jgi:hypothetical protein